MLKKNKYKNNVILSTYKCFATILCVSVFLGACGKEPIEADDSSYGTDAGMLAKAAELARTEDMGQTYVDSIIFIGESTTYHLKSRGVLKDGENTKQVWAPSSGTMNLDSSILGVRIVYQETKEEMTVGEAAKLKKPEIFMLTFGLNGAVGKVSKGKEYFKDCYAMLVDELRVNSPDSKIILQACPPISESMDVSAFSVSVKTLNEYIDLLNEWTRELCAEKETYYLASNSVLKNEKGFLKAEYDVGDGYHLNKAAYEKMLEYIRTHGIKEREE